MARHLVAARQTARAQNESGGNAFEFPAELAGEGAVGKSPPPRIHPEAISLKKVFQTAS